MTFASEIHINGSIERTITFSPTEKYAKNKVKMKSIGIIFVLSASFFVSSLFFSSLPHLIEFSYHHIRWTPVWPSTPPRMLLKLVQRNSETEILLKSIASFTCNWLTRSRTNVSPNACGWTQINIMRRRMLSWWAKLWICWLAKESLSQNISWNWRSPLMDPAKRSLLRPEILYSGSSPTTTRRSNKNALASQDYIYSL